MAIVQGMRSPWGFIFIVEEFLVYRGKEICIVLWRIQMAQILSRIGTYEFGPPRICGGKVRAPKESVYARLLELRKGGRRKTEGDAPVIGAMHVPMHLRRRHQSHESRATKEIVQTHPLIG